MIRPLDAGVSRPLGVDGLPWSESTAKEEDLDDIVREPDGVILPREEATDGGREKVVELEAADNLIDATNTPHLSGQKKYCLLGEVRILYGL